MTAHLSFSDPANDSQGFPLNGLAIELSETGFLTITGDDDTGTTWRLSLPVEHLATAVARTGQGHEQ